jgi:hypothetical protein
LKAGVRSKESEGRSKNKFAREKREYLIVNIVYRVTFNASVARYGFNKCVVDSSGFVAGGIGELRVIGEPGFIGGFYLVAGLCLARML